MNDREASRRRYSTILITIGIIILTYPILTEGYGAFAQYQLKSSWDAEILRQEKLAQIEERRQASRVGESAVTNENAVLTRIVGSGSARGRSDLSPFPPTKIRIPKLNIEQVVVEGIDVDALKSGPGHYPGTANPGQPGNVAIAGHRVTYTQPFNRIDELNSGDEIILETLDYIYTYKVTISKVLEPDDVSMLTPTDGAELTLTTCTPKYSARYRLDVRAALFKATPRQKPTIFRRLIASVAPPEPEKMPQNFLELATAEAKKSIAKNPQDFVARLRLGAAYQARKRYKEAESEYKRAAELNPGSAQPHYQLGLLYEQLTKTSLAIEELNQALILDPKNEDVIFKLGALYLKEKKYDQAIGVLQKGVEMSPYSADFHYNLGLALEKSGTRDIALIHYQQALQFVPDYQEAKAGLNRVLKKP